MLALSLQEEYDRNGSSSEIATEYVQASNGHDTKGASLVENLDDDFALAMQLQLEEERAFQQSQSQRSQKSLCGHVE